MFDIIVVFVVMLAMGVVSLVLYLVFDDVNTDLQSDDILNNESKDVVGSLHSKYPSLFDGIFVTIFALLWIAVLVSSLFIDTHPLFFIFGALLLGFVIFIAAVMANTYEDFSNEDEFILVSDRFPMTNFLMDNILIAVVAVGFSVLLALYAKSRLT